MYTNASLIYLRGLSYAALNQTQEALKCLDQFEKRIDSNNIRNKKTNINDRILHNNIGKGKFFIIRVFFVKYVLYKHST